jgi:phage gp36-like protein
MLIDANDLDLMYDSRRIDELSDDGSGADDDVITALISQADAFIKNQLAKKYTAAVIEADESLQRVCGDITMYYLEKRRSDTLPQDVELAYKNGVVYLQLLAQGEAILSGSTRVLPRITPSERENVMEQSGLWDGMPDSEENL